MQHSVFHINDEHSGKMTRWVKFINALVLPFTQLPSVRVVSLDPYIGFFQMMGHWTIHFAHLSGYGPVSCGKASCEPIELQPWHGVQSNSCQVTFTMPIAHQCWFDEDVRPCWIRYATNIWPRRTNGQTSVGRDRYHWPEVGHTMTCLVYMSWCKEVWNHLTHSPQVKWLSFCRCNYSNKCLKSCSVQVTINIMISKMTNKGITMLCQHMYYVALLHQLIVCMNQIKSNQTSFIYTPQISKRWIKGVYNKIQLLVEDDGPNTMGL